MIKKPISTQVMDNTYCHYANKILNSIYNWQILIDKIQVEPPSVHFTEQSDLIHSTLVVFINELFTIVE